MKKIDQDLIDQIARVSNEVLPNYECPTFTGLYGRACSEAAIRIRVDIDKANYALLHGSETFKEEMLLILINHD